MAAQPNSMLDGGGQMPAGRQPVPTPDERAATHQETKGTVAPHSAPAAAAGTFMLGGERAVNRLGFGNMHLATTPEAAGEVLGRAIELGVNFIDAHGIAGLYVADQLVAETLYPYPSDLVISAKVGVRREPGPSFSRQAHPHSLRADLEQALRRLKLDCLDLVYLTLNEGLGHDDPCEVPLSDSFGTLAQLSQEGKISHLGLSNITADTLAQARHIAPVAAVQNPYNLTNRSSEPVLQTCENNGIAFVPYFPLGSPTGNGRQRLLGQPTITRIAQAHTATPAQIALAGLLARSPVMLPIPSTSSVPHLEQNTGAAAVTLSTAETHELTTLPTTG